MGGDLRACLGEWDDTKKEFGKGAAFDGMALLYPPKPNSHCLFRPPGNRFSAPVVA
jgi:hypothetical protein